MVHFLAYRLWTKCPRNVGLDDLAQEGMIALWLALERFDPSKGCKLMTFAQSRVIGAMKDHLRMLDPLSRRERELRKASGQEDWGASVELLEGDAPHFDDDMLPLDERHLRSLSERERFVILQRLAGAEAQQLADHLRVSPTKISRITRNAIEKIQVLLGVAA